MRIGILTFHRAHNYGAMLQAYGLLTFLKSLGHEVSIIDYCPKLFKKAYRRNLPTIPRNPIKLCKKLVRELSVHANRVQRYDAFDDFMNSELSLYPWHKGFNGQEFDHIFIGSDQVWNKECLGQFDKVYWGDGLRCMVSTYAASMAWYRPSSQELSIIKKYLAQIYSLSVREKDAAEYLTTITSKPVTVVCDPTLLLKKDKWEFVCKPISPSEKYVLCYDLVSNSVCQEFAAKLSKAKGLKLLNIVGSVENDGIVNSLPTVGPGEFLSYFRDAEYVVTTSFHGTVFSLIFHKQFYSLGISKFGGRIQSLLEMLGLESRMQVPENLNDLEICDFREVNEKLEKFVASSKDYIINALSK